MSKIFRVDMSARAKRDFANAYDWLSEESTVRAKAWADGFIDAILGLETMPRRCRIAPDAKTFGRDIRQLIYGKRGHQYRILFEIDGQIVRILAIRHHAQDQLSPPVIETTTDFLDYKLTFFQTFSGTRHRIPIIIRHGAGT